MYGMTIRGKLFVDDLTDWLVKDAGFSQSECQGSIYYKILPDGSQLVVLSYVDDCIDYYTSEDLGRWFVGALGKRFNVTFLGHAHWFMSIRTTQNVDFFGVRRPITLMSCNREQIFESRDGTRE
jgi:hypothetical protein